MNVLELSEQEIGRRQSLLELRSMGIDPYPAAEFPTNAFSTEIRENVECGMWNVEGEMCNRTACWIEKAGDQGQSARDA